MKKYIVWNQAGNEGYATSSYGDAVTAATGEKSGAYSYLAYEFFDNYGDDGELKIEEVKP